MEPQRAASWDNWEGQTVDGIFTLHRYLGGSENSAVYLTDCDDRRAALKLVEADPQTDSVRLSRWQSATKLSHPHLVGLFRSGRCQLDGTDFLYVVMEYADEDLSQVLPHRALTPDEAMEMSRPTLDALDYLHRQGLVHGNLKPSNIMAAGDQLKLSTDGLLPIGEKLGSSRSVYHPPEETVSPQSDTWSFGVTLVQILTQRLPVWNRAVSNEAVLPAGLPEPFAATIRQCLRSDPEERPGTAGVSDGLANRTPSGSSPRHFKLAYAAIALVVALGGIAILLHRGSSTAAPQVSPQPPQATPQVVQTAPAQPQPTRKESRSSKENRTAPAQSQTAASQDLPEEVLEHPMPEVTQNIRNTIHGRVRITVKVTLDPTGNVTAATLEPGGGSKYLGERALKVVRQWKFRPQSGNPEYTLRFVFTKNDTAVSARRTSISVEKPQ